MRITTKRKMRSQKPNESFWLKVMACEMTGGHRWSPEYSERYSCTCNQSHESHCLRCGCYNTEDPCGEQTGISGWPAKRWKNKNAKSFGFPNNVT